MHSLFVIFCFAIIAVMGRPEPPVSHFGRSSISNSLFGPPSSRYGTPDMSDHSQDSYNAAYRHSSTQHQTGYDNGPQETQVHKHIYVHVPPQEFEDEAMTPRVTHQVAPKQKHYKIVFIKSPSAPKVHAPIVPPAPQNEEKTLIYVLHKKPQTQPEIIIPTPAPTTPSKPEVYFIKYKTKKNEAPVYGPPPQIEERSDLSLSNDYGTPISNDISDSHISDNELELQSTTSTPIVIAETETSKTSDSPNTEIVEPPNQYLPPQTTTPNNQYLPPQTTMAPIVVADVEEDQAHVPAVTYGAPKRYFIKRRK